MANEELLKKAVEAFKALTPEQQAEMLEEQRQSWVRGNVGLSRDERGITTPVMPRPAAPVEGLETVGYVTTSPTGAEVFQRKPLVPGHGQFGYKQDAVVTRSQADELLAAERAETMRQVKHWSELYKQQHYRAEKAEAIIAAKDAKIADLENELSSFRSSFKEQTSLKSNNAALTARIKELEAVNAKLCDDAIDCELKIAERDVSLQALETQLATTRKALEFYGDVHKYPAPLTGGMGDLWRDCGAIARNALTETFMPTHTHLKRGSSYSYFGTGTFQTDSWVYPHRYVDMGENEEDMLSCDMQQVAVYLEDDGKIWVRPVGEFNDGRFAKIEDDQ